MNHAKHKRHAATVAHLDAKREAVRVALGEYVLACKAAAVDISLNAAEQRSADMSGVQAEAAERVMWMD
jgi:hypothetical protein